jgi:NAD(P)-dependent dehydrogenase (short-subunit alcohol dehydrogenase family)
MFSLTGKSCVVTGASRGLGRAIALAYAAQGADLVVTARSRDDLERLRAEIEALGRRAEVRAGDVTDLAHLRAVGAAAVSAFGKLDVWVNNAGGDTTIAGGWTEWLDVTEEGWERMLSLNLKAQVFGAQIAARLMRDGTTGGSIIFLRSLRRQSARRRGDLRACKAAINNVTLTMAINSASTRSASTRSRRRWWRRR